MPAREADDIEAVLALAALDLERPARANLAVEGLPLLVASFGGSYQRTPMHLFGLIIASLPM